MPDFPDVSEYQGRPVWGAVKQAGFAGGMCKAYEFRIDGQFYYNWNAMADVGFVRGAYCFGRPSFAPQVQASLFADVVLGAGYQASDWPLVLDAEVPGISSQWCLDFLATLDARTGRRSILYTYSSFLSSDLGSDVRLAGWPLWIANYSSHVSTPWPYWAWQYTDNGFVPGIGNCDVSHLVGSTPTPIPDNEDDMPKYTQLCAVVVGSSEPFVPFVYNTIDWTKKRVPSPAALKNLQYNVWIEFQADGSPGHVSPEYDSLFKEV